MAALRSTFLAALATLTCLSSARAEQVVLVDVTYTHAADTTTDSHFYVAPSAATPANWKQPVSYAGGSLHMRLEVKTKPSSANTQYQACFEKGSNAACAALSSVYTTPTTLEWDDPVANFWNASTMDWSKGVDKIALILKDDKNNKPQGDPRYVPTDLHVVVTLVAAGSTYEAPRAGGHDGGVELDAGQHDVAAPEVRPEAGARDAGDALDAGREPEPDAAVPPRVDAAIHRDASADARASADDGSASSDDGAPDDDTAPRVGNSGCALGVEDAGGWWLLLVLFTRRRRRRP